MFLSDIIIYPIKSLPGVRISESRVEQRGLQYDRRWMLVDENNKVITLRKYPQMLLFDIHLEEEGFVVKHRESSDTLEMPWSISEGNEVKVTIWDDEVTALEADAAWGAWMEDKLDISCRLVYMGEKTSRPVKQEWSQNGEIVSFADSYPMLLVGSASLAELNTKLEKHITIDRFRPNLVFEGGDPYEEFRWGKFKVGECLFQGLKPCERCIATTFDPITAERGKEPLLTLSKQKINDKIVFGQHAYALNMESIHINDKIEVLNYKDAPYDPITTSC